MRVAALVLCVLCAEMVAGCSAVTIRQKPFPPLEVTAQAPEQSRARVTGSQISFDEKIQFAVGSATILEPSYEILDEVARLLIQNPNLGSVRIEGHTDSTGSRRRNKRLSAERAEAVMKYLVETAGINPARLSAEGFGSERPIADNESPEGREQNRRVEFHIVPAEGAASETAEQG